MRSIKKCLNKQLADLCERSIQLEDLSKKVSQFIPTPLANSCHVGSFSKGCLVLTTSNASFASQLRYALPELRDKLRKEGGIYQLSSIKIIITEPTTEYKKLVSQTSYSLSEQAKTSIIQESEYCSYEPLKQALIHLAQGNSPI